MPFSSGHRFPVLCDNKLITCFRKYLKDFIFQVYLDKSCLYKIYLFIFIYNSSWGANRQEEARIWKNSRRKFVEISKYLAKIIMDELWWNWGLIICFWGNWSKSNPRCSAAGTEVWMCLCVLGNQVIHLIFNLGEIWDQKLIPFILLIIL